MTWLAPALAGIAAAIAIPTLIILYFLKLRRRDVEISTTLLWKKSIQDLQANAPFQRLRRNILLLLQLLILAGALLAVAQPQIMGESPSGGRHVIVIDRSASMSAEDETGDAGTVSRLDKAKEQATALVDSLPEPGLFSGTGGDTAMVIVFDTQADVRQTFTADKAALRRAIEGITPVDTPTSLKQATQLVAANAPRLTFVDETTGKVYERPAGGVGTIHLYSDGRIPDADQVKFGPEDTLEYTPAGGAGSVNLGITSLRAVRDFNEPDRLSIFVGVQSTDPAPRDVDVELVIDDAQARIETVSLPGATDPITGAAGGDAPAPGGPSREPGTGGVVFEMDRREGGIVSVTLRTPSGKAPDQMAVDNRAWLVVPPSKKLAIAVVTRGNLFIADALRELPLSRLETFTPDQYEALIASGQGGDFDVVVLDGWLPPVPDAPASETPTPGDEAGAPAGAQPPAPPSLPPGRFLILNAVPAPPLGPIDKGPKEELSVMLGWSRDHPAFRNLALDNLYIFTPRIVEVPDNSGVKVLASADTGPAILELNTAETRAIIVPFDVAASNWGFDVSWVIFLGQATQYLGEENSTGIARMVQPGQTLTDRLPLNITDVRIQAPDESSTPLIPGPDGTVVFGPVLKTGIYRLSWQGEAGAADLTINGRIVRPFTANLLDSAESDLGTITRFETASSTVQAQIGEGSRSPRKLWPWLILAALSIALLEWFVYNRKVHV